MVVKDWRHGKYFWSFATQQTHISNNIWHAGCQILDAIFIFHQLGTTIFVQSRIFHYCLYSHHMTTTILQPFFRDHPGEPVPEENVWTLWCKGRLTEADTSIMWLGTTPSGLSSAHLHHPPHFLQAKCPSCCRTNSVKAPKATIVYIHSSEKFCFVQKNVCLNCTTFVVSWFSGKSLKLLPPDTIFYSKNAPNLT